MEACERKLEVSALMKWTKPAGRRGEGVAWETGKREETAAQRRPWECDKLRQWLQRGPQTLTFTVTLRDPLESKSPGQ